MAGADVQEVCTEQVLFGSIADAYLSHSNEVLIFADVVRKAFVTKGVDFASDNKTVCPNLY